MRGMIPLQESELILAYEDNGKLTEVGKKLKKAGIEILKSKRNLGVVILSGGEGTRLGLTYPKGLFKLENKTLFEWHLSRLQTIYEKYNTNIYLFIMTSDSTHYQVSEFFSKNNFSFLQDIEIFKQNSIEALDIKTGNKLLRDGKLIMNPMGNGDIFDSIQKCKNLNKVDAINVISVDNALANILDEVFVGAFFSNKLDILSKAVKALPNESVGAFFIIDNHIKIEEYSESKSRSGIDVFGNICNHMFSTNFVRSMGNQKLPLHEAHKKIPFTDSNGILVKPTTPNGIKREKFIFDCFEYTTKNSVICVPRTLEFSPLKNSVESPCDNPKTCSNAVREYRIKSNMLGKSK